MAKNEDSNKQPDGSAAAIAALIPSPCTTRGPESWGDVHAATGDRVYFYFQLCASPGTLMVDLDNISSGSRTPLIPAQNITTPVKVLLPTLQKGSYNLVWTFIVPPGVAWQNVTEVSVQGAGSGVDVVLFRMAKRSDGARPVNHGFARIEVR